MTVGRRATRVLALIAPLFVIAGYAGYAWAHCDGLDGPVVKAAQRALESGNVNFALVWVQPADEAELREAFRQALEVRSLGPDARTLADRHFYETTVRLHRTGEGAAYTGLAPAGRDLGPAIPAADLAVASGDLGALERLLTESVLQGLDLHFAELREASAYEVNDVAAGRDYVRAYVEFVHYVERVHQAASTAAVGHYPEHVER
jgi:hypothetical protein